MARAGRDADLRVKGMGLKTRFVLSMSIALTVVMLIAGALLFVTTRNIVESSQLDLLRNAMLLTARAPEWKQDGTTTAKDPGTGVVNANVRYGPGDSLQASLFELRTPQPEEKETVQLIVPEKEGQVGVDYTLRDLMCESLALTVRPLRYEATEVPLTHSETGVQFRPITYGAGNRKIGMLYEATKHIPAREQVRQWLVPQSSERTARQIGGLIIGIMVTVVAVGAAVALFISGQVSAPLSKIVDDIRQISKGDLSHRTHAQGGGEIELLARSIDRMTRDLETAQDAQLELSIHEREMEVAAEVREALLPIATPDVAGYDVGAARLNSSELGGDFHDYIELPDGRLGLLVCDVSGKGMPAALIGATARSYLRSRLIQGGDLEEDLRQVNRELVQDVRRGMFVTAFYALLDPAKATVTVASAGHKMPLLRYCAEDRKLRLVHPEGIALGFDRGPVFDRSLQIQELPFAPGDRLVLANTGPVKVLNPAGEELGEKPFFQMCMRYSHLSTPKFLKGLRQSLEEFANGAPLPTDISLVTIARQA